METKDPFDELFLIELERELGLVMAAVPPALADDELTEKAESTPSNGAAATRSFWRAMAHYLASLSEGDASPLYLFWDE